MLFGATKPKGLFGGATPGLGDGMKAMAAESPAAKPKKGGLFGSGISGWQVLGMIGDVLSDDEPIYTQNLLAQRKAQSERDAYQREQQDKWDFWQRQQEYKRVNPDPVSNDTVNDYNFWKQTLPPEQFQQWVQNRINPPQYRQGPDGQFYRIDGGAQAQTGPMPTFTEDDWNKAGGGGGNATGGFR